MHRPAIESPRMSFSIFLDLIRALSLDDAIGGLHGL
jgi:hypothetical protein